MGNALNQHLSNRAVSDSSSHNLAAVLIKIRYTRIMSESMRDLPDASPRDPRIQARCSQSERGYASELSLCEELWNSIDTGTGRKLIGVPGEIAGQSSQCQQPSHKKRRAKYDEGSSTMGWLKDFEDSNQTEEMISRRQQPSLANHGTWQSTQSMTSLKTQLKKVIIMWCCRDKSHASK